MNMKTVVGLIAASLFCAHALAKLPPAPPAPPLDPVAAAAKAEKDKAAADKVKALQAVAEDRAVGNFQANMKKAGKPVPKPTPIVVAAAPATVTTALPAKPGVASPVAVKPAAAIVKK